MQRQGRPPAFIDRMRLWHMQDQQKRVTSVRKKFRDTFGKEPNGLSTTQAERVMVDREEAKRRQDAYATYWAVFGRYPNNMSPEQVVRVVANREAALRNRNDHRIKVLCA